MREKLSSFLNSVLGGVCIGIGGVVFLSCENKVTGAVFFCLGLFAICTFGFNLFTGKVGYIFEQPPRYTAFVASVWLGNLVGTGLPERNISAGPTPWWTVCRLRSPGRSCSER